MKLLRIMTKSSSNKQKVLALFKPDEKGFSDWVKVSEFKKAGLNWSNNGNIRRGVAFGLTEIKWEVARLNSGRSRVVQLRMVGWSLDLAFDQKIEPRIRLAFEVESCCNLSQLRIPQPDIEIDHRYGYKDHPDYVSCYSAANQEKEHFQLIHRVLNLQKRQMCAECVSTRTRPPHPTLGYAEGGADLPDRFPCRGCFLAEPERYRRLN
jgi:hypothetical protein